MGVCVCVRTCCVYLYIYICIYNIYIYVPLRMYITVMIQIYIYIVWEISWLQPSDKPPCNILHLAVIPRWRFRPRNPNLTLGIGMFVWPDIPEFCSKILQQKKGHASHVASSGFHISPGDRILVSQLISPLVYPFTPFDLIGQYSRGIWYVAWQKWSIQNPATTFLIFDN